MKSNSLANACRHLKVPSWYPGGSWSQLKEPNSFVMVYVSSIDSTCLQVCVCVHVQYVCECTSTVKSCDYTVSIPGGSTGLWPSLPVSWSSGGAQASRTGCPSVTDPRWVLLSSFALGPASSSRSCSGYKEAAANGRVLCCVCVFGLEFSSGQWKPGFCCLQELYMASHCRRLSFGSNDVWNGAHRGVWYLLLTKIQSLLI